MPVCRYLVMSLLIGLILWPLAGAHGFTAPEIARMKEAGVDDETLKLLVESRADILGLVDVEGVLRLKESGVGNDVIRALVSSEAAPGRARTYGTARLDPVGKLTAESLLLLKNEGFSDDLLQAVVEIHRRELWPVLFHLGILRCTNASPKR